ncbi:hypothetical protein DFJ77DRAFT_463323 [Powellomyces hirtus]|nr:hypothetical protein DFJ77DRAFT_463323 [Powellomyces hirtus]
MANTPSRTLKARSKGKRTDAGAKLRRSNTDVSGSTDSLWMDDVRSAYSDAHESAFTASGAAATRGFNLAGRVCHATFQLGIQLFTSILRLFAPYIVGIVLLLVAWRFLSNRFTQLYSWGGLSCDSPIVDRLPILALACGRPGTIESAQQLWCDHGGAYLTSTTCNDLIAAKERRLEEAVGIITKTTFETVDQGRQLVIRTHGLPEPRSLALRSTNLHSLQWAVLYHTNFSDKARVADGLRLASTALDGTVDALIELKGDSEYALHDMVDQFEQIERALHATLTGKKSLKELEETFDDSLKATDELLERLQITAVDTAEKATKTKNAVQRVQQHLSMEKRSVNLDSDKVAPPLMQLFCSTCLSKTQARQLKQDLEVWDDCNGQMTGLSNDLAVLGVELSQFRHNVKLVQSAWRRSAWIKGDVQDQIESLRGRVAQLKALMDGQGNQIKIETLP